LEKRHEAQLIDDEQLVGGELILTPEQALLVACLHEFVDEGSRGREADGKTLLAGGETQAQRDDVLAAGAEKNPCS
jgi:hypothetical protein